MIHGGLGFPTNYQVAKVWSTGTSWHHVYVHVIYPNIDSQKIINHTDLPWLLYGCFQK